MLREEKNSDAMKIMVARVRGKDETLEEVRLSRTVMDEVLKNGKSVLTADAPSRTVIRPRTRPRR